MPKAKADQREAGPAREPRRRRSRARPARTEIHTDGSCLRNPGPGGWAAVIAPPSGKVQEISGGEPETTNNRMELTAAAEALEALPAGARVRLSVDSSYVTKGIAQWLPGWKAAGWRTRGGRPLKNLDLWQRLERAAERVDAKWRWVKAHNGDPGNERADRLARKAARAARDAAGQRPPQRGGTTPAAAPAAPRPPKGSRRRPPAPPLPPGAVRVLDRGFVRLVETMGTDRSVVEAARVSYGQGTRTVRDDRRLIRYLMRHRHTSPFEMCVAVFHLRMPVYVARQWLRHRTASVSELSGRYSEMPSDVHLPEPAAQPADAGQGRGAPLPPEPAARLAGAARDGADRAVAVYREMLDGGVAREIARAGLPLGVYTEMRWSMDLHNLLGFIEQRTAPGAQEETRAYAEALLGMVRKWCPVSAEAFEDHRLHAVTLPRGIAGLVRERLQGRISEDDLDGLGLTPRERREFRGWLDAPPPAPPKAPRRRRGRQGRRARGEAAA